MIFFTLFFCCLDEANCGIGYLENGTDPSWFPFSCLISRLKKFDSSTLDLMQTYVEYRERSSQNREDERKWLRRMLIKVASLLFSFPSSSSSLFVSLEAHQDLVIMSYYRWWPRERQFDLFFFQLEYYLIPFDLIYV